MTVMKTFHDEINLHQATMTPITVMPEVVAAYTVSRGTTSRHANPKRTIRTLHLQMACPILTPIINCPISNGAVETSATRLPLMRVMKNPLLIRGRRSLVAQ
jgi:hypothetical protein